MRKRCSVRTMHDIAIKSNSSVEPNFLVCLVTIFFLSLKNMHILHLVKKTSYGYFIVLWFCFIVKQKISRLENSTMLINTPWGANLAESSLNGWICLHPCENEIRVVHVWTRAWALSVWIRSCIHLFKNESELFCVWSPRPKVLWAHSICKWVTYPL